MIIVNLLSSIFAWREREFIFNHMHYKIPDVTRHARVTGHKVQLKRAFLIACCLSSVSPSVTFHIFNFFSRTIGPISTKLGTEHPWMEGIQVCSIEWPRPSPRGDDSEIIKLYWKYFKIFFSRTTGPISTKHKTKLPWMEGIYICSNEGPRLSLRGDNSKIVKLY